MELRLPYPLGFKIVATTGDDNTGSAIDERMVMDDVGTDFLKYDAATNIPLYYEGLLSYVIGVPYHGSGITTDAGFWFRNSSNTWQGLVADTVDDKHADGTMDSTSNATTDPNLVPAEQLNITNHVNYLYTLYNGILAGSRTWQDPVEDVTTTVPTLGAGDVGKRYAINGVGTGAWAEHDGDIATWDNSTPWTFEVPSDGWAAISDTDSKIYIYNSALPTYWARASADIPNLSDTVSGIVSNTWYDDLYDFVTNTSDYLNQNAFSSIIAQNNGAGISGSPISAGTPTSSLTLNLTGNLTGSISGSTLTLNSTGGTTITSNPYQLIYNDGSSVTGTGNIFSNGHSIYFGDDIVYGNRNIQIGSFISPDVDTYITDNIIIGDVAGYNLKDFTGSAIATNNILIGKCAGVDLTETSSNRFIISSGYYSSTANVLNESSIEEYRLIDGNFPTTIAGYGDMKIRGIVYFKETTTYIDSIDNGSTRDLTFYDTHVGTTTTLYNLVNNSASSLTASNGITRTSNNFALNGPLTGATSIFGSYTFALTCDGLTLNGGTSGVSMIGNTFSFTIGTDMPATYSTDVSANVLLDNDIPNMKFVVDYVADNAGSVITGAASTIVTSDLTASRALISNASGKVAVSTVTDVELECISGVASAIQDQIDSKEDTVAPGTTSQYYRGDKSWSTLDTDAVSEGSNLYLSDTNFKTYVLAKGSPVSGYVLGTTGTDIEWIAQANMDIDDNILYWDSINLLYMPYSAKTNGCFYTHTDQPSNSDIALKFDGTFTATSIYSTVSLETSDLSVTGNGIFTGYISGLDSLFLLDPDASDTNYVLDTSETISSGNLLTINNNGSNMLLLDYDGNLSTIGSITSGTNIVSTTSISSGTTLTATTTITATTGDDDDAYFYLGTKWRFSIGASDELQFEYYNGSSWIIKANIEV